MKFLTIALIALSAMSSIQYVSASHPLERDLERISSSLRNFHYCEPITLVQSTQAGIEQIKVKLLSGAVSQQIDLSDATPPQQLTTKQREIFQLIKTEGGLISIEEKQILLNYLSRCSLDPSVFETSGFRSLIGLVYEIFRDAKLKLTYADSEITYGDLFASMSMAMNRAGDFVAQDPDIRQAIRSGDVDWEKLRRDLVAAFEPMKKTYAAVQRASDQISQNYEIEDLKRLLGPSQFKQRTAVNVPYVYHWNGDKFYELANSCSISTTATHIESVASHRCFENSLKAWLYRINGDWRTDRENGIQGVILVSDLVVTSELYRDMLDRESISVSVAKNQFIEKTRIQDNRVVNFLKEAESRESVRSSQKRNNQLQGLMAALIGFGVASGKIPLGSFSSPVIAPPTFDASSPRLVNEFNDGINRTCTYCCRQGWNYDVVVRANQLCPAQ